MFLVSFISRPNHSYLFNFKGKGKVVPLFNQAPRHEEVLGGGGIAPRIP
jgi:hypothetical protein